MPRYISAAFVAVLWLYFVGSPPVCNAVCVYWPNRKTAMSLNRILFAVSSCLRTWTLLRLADVIGCTHAPNNANLLTFLSPQLPNALMQVHKLHAGDDDVNSVLLALPRPRSRARSGPLSAVAEQVLASAAVPRRWGVLLLSR